MSKKLTWYSIVLLLAASFLISAASVDAADVTGCWSLNGKGALISTVKGQGVFRDAGPMNGQFCLNPDKSFYGSMFDVSGLTGNWIQRGRKLILKLDTSSVQRLVNTIIQNFIMDEFGEWAEVGLNKFKKAFLRAKIKGNNKLIKGKLVLKGGKGNLWVDRKYSFTCKGTGKYKGRRM